MSEHGRSVQKAQPLPYVKVGPRSNPEGNSVDFIIETGNPQFPVLEARIHTYLIQRSLASFGSVGEA